MVDLLAQGAAWLAGQRAANMATRVMYTRLSSPPATVVIAATIGTTAYEIDDGYGAVERFVSRDFLITASDLVLRGVAIQPQPGDQIAETTAAGVCVYELMGPGKESCWRWSDPYRNSIRVHTKQVQT